MKAKTLGCQWGAAGCMGMLGRFTRISKAHAVATASSETQGGWRQPSRGRHTASAPSCGRQPRPCSTLVPHWRARAVVRSPGVLKLRARQRRQAGLPGQVGRGACQLARQTGKHFLNQVRECTGLFRAPALAPAPPAAQAALSALLPGSHCSACGQTTGPPSGQLAAAFNWLPILGGQPSRVIHTLTCGRGCRRNRRASLQPCRPCHMTCTRKPCLHRPQAALGPHLSASTMTPADARMLPRLHRARSSSCAVSISSVTVAGWCASRSASSVSLRSSNQADRLATVPGG